MSLRWFYKYIAEGRGPEAVEIDGHKFYLKATLAEWNKNRRKRKKGKE